MEEEIRKKILGKKPDIVMNRVPKKTKDWFLKFSEEEFCSDYGMCLKYLCDMFQGVMAIGQEAVLAQLEVLEQRIIMLEGKHTPKEKDSRKTLSGKNIGKGD